MAMLKIGGHMCADFTGSGLSFEESAANCRLAAAAPELLAAVKAMVGPLSAFYDVTEDDAGNPIMKSAGNALALAQSALDKVKQ